MKEIIEEIMTEVQECFYKWILKPYKNETQIFIVTSTNVFLTENFYQDTLLEQKLTEWKNEEMEISKPVRRLRG